MVDDAHQVGVAFPSAGCHQAEHLALFLATSDDRRAEKRPRDLSVDERFR